MPSRRTARGAPGRRIHRRQRPRLEPGRQDLLFRRFGPRPHLCLRLRPRGRRHREPAHPRGDRRARRPPRRAGGRQRRFHLVRDLGRVVRAPLRARRARRARAAPAGAAPDQRRLRGSGSQDAVHHHGTHPPAVAGSRRRRPSRAGSSRATAPVAGLPASEFAAR